MTEAARSERNATLRLALGGTLALVWGWAMLSPLPGVAAMLAVQLLAGSPGGLPAKLGLMLVAVTAASAILAYVIAGLFADHPLILVLALGLMLWHGFRLAEQGRALIATMVVNMGVIIPVMTVQSTLFGGAVVMTVVGEVVRGIACVFLMHAVLPVTVAAQAQARIPPPPVPSWFAPAKVVLLMPVLLFYLETFNVMSLAALTALAAFLLAGGGAAGQQVLWLNFFGNVIGCAAAAIATTLLPLLPPVAGVVLLSLFFTLFFSARIKRYGPGTVGALVTFLLMFGMTLSPVLTLPSVSQRLIDMAVLSIYALGAASLLLPSQRPAAA